MNLSKPTRSRGFGALAALACLTPLCLSDAGCRAEGQQPAFTKDPAVEHSAAALFVREKDDQELFANHRIRLKGHGSERRRKHYSTVPAGGTVGIQFSQRKRLFDHNILLRALFAGRLEHARFGNLKSRFEGALFFDLGSAILFREGAPTVRDIHDDSAVRSHLSALVASDINDPASERTKFVDIYRKKKNNLPFPVHEIPMSITTPQQVRALLAPYSAGPLTPVILRTVNTGIDYYYSEAQLRDHLHAVLAGSRGRDLLYMFNKYVLFCPKEIRSFTILGLVPEWVFDGEARGWPWRRVNWARRALKDSFQRRDTELRILEQR